jgi:hypothetical protein
MVYFCRPFWKLVQCVHQASLNFGNLPSSSDLLKRYVIAGVISSAISFKNLPLRHNVLLASLTSFFHFLLNFQYILYFQRISTVSSTHSRPWWRAEKYCTNEFNNVELRWQVFTFIYIVLRMGHSRLFYQTVDQHFRF